MATLLLIPAVIILSVLMVLLAIGAFFKFFKRNEARERAIEDMIASRRDLLMKIADMQNMANTMQVDIDNEIRRLPVQSKKAFAGKQTLLLRDR